MATPLFSVGEKVLCYEPDKKKARVLYDSKVLRVVPIKGEDGKVGSYEYFIHFQGWKKTHDKQVEEFDVLKYTDENKDLQRELRESVSYFSGDGRRKKKGGLKGGKGKGRVGGGEGGKGASEGKGLTDESSDEEEVVMRPEQLVIPDAVREVLEHDYREVKVERSLSKLPAKVTVLEILEEYISIMAQMEIQKYLESVERMKKEVGVTGSTKNARLMASLRQNRSLNDMVNEELIQTFKRIAAIKKTAEYVRIMFDVMLPEILLYKSERRQYNQYLSGRFHPKGKFRERKNYLRAVVKEDSDDPIVQNVIKKNMPPPPVPPLKRRTRSSMNNNLVNGYLDGDSKAHVDVCVSRSKSNSASGDRDCPAVDPTTPLAMIPLSEIKKEPSDDEPKAKRKKESASISTPCNSSLSPVSMMPAPSQSSSKGQSPAAGSKSECKKSKAICDHGENCDFPFACQHLNKFMDELSKSELLPESERYGAEPHPSVCYGITHLLRLFVRLPDILNPTIMPKQRMSTVIVEMNSMLQYVVSLLHIVSKNDWYSPTKPKKYAEDYITEKNCHLFAKGTPSRKMLKRKSGRGRVSKWKHARNAIERAGGNRATNSAKGTATSSSKSSWASSNGTARVGTRNSTATVTRSSLSMKKQNAVNSSEKIRSGTETANQAPPAASNTTSPRGLIQNSSSGTGIRQLPRRLSVKSDPSVITGAALGVRKSLTQEELSRETLVAASANLSPQPGPSGSKPGYSLRNTARPSYSLK